MGDKSRDNVRLDGKTVIITGANTGIGKETAKDLASRGARVILACRSEVKANKAREEIITETGNQNIAVKLLDLASFASIKEFAEDINKVEDRLDILVCNAGVATIKRFTTDDNMELMFGVNHLGHFLLTNLLLDKLVQSSPSRVVILASEAHKFSSMDFQDLQHERSFKPFKVYSRSKTCNILFGVHLARILKDTTVNVYIVHPGLVDTELSRDIPMTKNCYKCIVTFLSCTKFKTPVSGAETTVYCCVEPSIAEHSGRYYSECKEKTPKRYATDKDNAKELWSKSLELCGIVDQEYEPRVTSL